MNVNHRTKEQKLDGNSTAFSYTQAELFVVNFAVWRKEKILCRLLR